MPGNNNDRRPPSAETAAPNAETRHAPPARNPEAPERWPERRATPPLYLDRHLCERFRSHSPFDTEHVRHAPVAALRYWQWLHLGRTLLRAAGHGLHYKEALGGIQNLLSETEKNFPRKDGGLFPPQECTEQALARVLHSLPFTLPQELAQHPEHFLCVSHSAVSGVISLTTSGTSAAGQGKRIFCTEGDMARTAAFFQHGMQFMVSARQKDRVALLMSGERPGSVGQLLLRGMRDLGVDCSVPGFVGPGAEDAAAMLKTLHELRATCLVGVPGQILRLARTPGARALLPHVRTALLSGDTVTPPLRRGIADGFGCEVFVHYGLTETGLGGAVECAEHNGCHLREADMLTEIVDEAGRPVADGRFGEIVLTTLTREAMPLLRYRTGDEGRVIPGVCACGSILRRIEVRGRMSERLPLPLGGHIHTSELESLLYSLPVVADYEAVLYEGVPTQAPPCLLLRLTHTAASEQEATAAVRAALAQHPSLCNENDAPAHGRLPVALQFRAEGQAEGNAPPARGQAKKSVRRVAGPRPDKG